MLVSSVLKFSSFVTKPKLRFNESAVDVWIIILIKTIFCIFVIQTLTFPQLGFEILRKVFCPHVEISW